MFHVEPDLSSGFHVKHNLGSIGAILRELRVSPEAMSLLLSHAAAVEDDADRLGLVSRSDIGHVLDRHTADSLLFALVREPQAEERWIDVGSGAGFPGLVLAACYPIASFLLLEPQRRRAAFLEMQAARLGLDNVVVMQERADTLEPGFDVAVARALAEPSLAIEALWRLVEPEGEALLAVGRDAHPFPGVVEVRLDGYDVDSPRRFFMMSAPAGTA